MSGTSNRSSRILDILTSGPASASAIASQLNAPEASIRRTVQELRQRGWRIDDARDFNGQYRLLVNTPSTVAASI